MEGIVTVPLGEYEVHFVYEGETVDGKTHSYELEVPVGGFTSSGTPLILHEEGLKTPYDSDRGYQSWYLESSRLLRTPAQPGWVVELWKFNEDEDFMLEPELLPVIEWSWSHQYYELGTDSYAICLMPLNFGDVQIVRYDLNVDWVRARMATAKEMARFQTAPRLPNTWEWIESYEYKHRNDG